MKKDADIYLVDEIGEKMFYSDEIQHTYNKVMLDESKMFIGTVRENLKVNMKRYGLTN